MNMQTIRVLGHEIRLAYDDPYWKTSIDRDGWSMGQQDLGKELTAAVALVTGELMPVDKALRRPYG